MSSKDSLTLKLLNILNSNKSQKLSNVSAASNLQIILEWEGNQAQRNCSKH